MPRLSPKQVLAPAPKGNRVQLSEARSAARAWSESVQDKWRVNQAALFAYAAMTAYAEATVPCLKLSQPIEQPCGTLDKKAQMLAASIGKEASNLSVVEATHYLASLYPSLLPQAIRSEAGAFYTPPALSSRLLELATEGGLDWATARVLDPAAGGGAFLVQAALKMRQALPDGEPAFILAQLGNRLLGLELDAHAASLAQASLEILLADLSLASGRPVPVMVRVCDTLEEAPCANFDLVVGNPPYGRIKLTDLQRQRFARSLSQCAD